MLHSSSTRRERSDERLAERRAGQGGRDTSAAQGSGLKREAFEGGLLPLLANWGGYLYIGWIVRVEQLVG